jgi:DNA uptake protein ComE-like DNA-binding protein
MKWPNNNLKNLRTMKDIISSKFKPKKFNLNNATLSDIMSLNEMEKDLAIEIYEYIKDNIITDASDLLEIESIDKEMIATWSKSFDDMRFDINKVDKNSLKRIKGINGKTNFR